MTDGEKKRERRRDREIEEGEICRSEVAQCLRSLVYSHCNKINDQLPHYSMTGIPMATAAISFKHNLFTTYQNHVSHKKQTKNVPFLSPGLYTHSAVIQSGGGCKKGKISDRNQTRRCFIASLCHDLRVNTFLSSAI